MKQREAAEREIQAFKTSQLHLEIQVWVSALSDNSLPAAVVRPASQVLEAGGVGGLSGANECKVLPTCLATPPAAAPCVVSRKPDQQAAPHSSRNITFAVRPQTRDVMGLYSSSCADGVK